MSSVFERPSAEKLREIADRSKARAVSPLDIKKIVDPRPFTPGEKSLIRRVHSYMPVQQLLGVLNERLAGDHPGATPFTVAQLYAEIGNANAMPTGGHDWSSLRKLVAKARREGVLDAVTRQVIDDFAVVYSLSSGQVLRLHDVLLRAKEEE